MIPRLPVNMPRCGIERMSPNGVTRFCNGIEWGFKSLVARCPAWDRPAEVGRDRAIVRTGPPLAAMPPRRAVCRRAADRQAARIDRNRMERPLPDRPRL